MIAIASGTISSALLSPPLQRQLTQEEDSSIAFAAETVGKDPNCNGGSCIGVWDGLLADCPHGRGAVFKTGAGCTSSQDDTPGIFSEPWDYSESTNNLSDWEAQMKLLIPAILFSSTRRGDTATIVLQEGRYLRVDFIDGKSGEKSIGEFYFTPSDTTVQFRIASSPSSSSGIGGSAAATIASLKNSERCEMIRKQLRYLKVPVLRNRKRSLFFVESDLDSFGPGSAALGPPAEMRTGEIEGRFSDNVDPRLRIDQVQMFPIK